jgi:hypothetical protein
VLQGKHLAVDPVHAVERHPLEPVAVMSEQGTKRLVIATGGPVERVADLAEFFRHGTADTLLSALVGRSSSSGADFLDFLVAALPR